METINTVQGAVLEKVVGSLTAISEGKKTFAEIETEVKALEEVKEAFRLSEIRERVERLNFFADCKNILKAHLIEPTEETKKTLIAAVKGLVKAAYFAGTSADRFYTVEIEKTGRICAYVTTNDGPVIGNDSLGLIKTKEISQYIGLLIKHNGVTTSFIGELFKINNVEATPFVEVQGVKNLFTQVKPDFQKVVDSFNSDNIPTKIGYVTVITIDQSGKKSFKQKPVLATETTEQCKGIVKRFAMHNRLQEKAVSTASRNFLAETKKGLKSSNKK